MKDEIPLHMKHTAVLLAALLLLTIARTRVDAQWEVVLKDQTRRDLNAVFFVDREAGWVVGDGGIIHATLTSGEDWFAQNAKVNASLSDASVKSRYADVGAVPIILTPDEARLRIAKDIEKWRKVIETAGLRPE